jgi:hypothetical protein
MEGHDTHKRRRPQAFARMCMSTKQRDRPTSPTLQETAARGGHGPPEKGERSSCKGPTPRTEGQPHDPPGGGATTRNQSEGHNAGHP